MKKKTKKEEVIFLEDTKWGKKFDKKFLKRGFVKYLLESEKVFFDNEKSRKIIKNILEKEKKLLKKISEIILRFELKTNEEGETFGTINIRDIINKLEEKLDFKLKENNFPDFFPLSGIGEKEIGIKIGGEISRLKILIEKKF